MKIPDDKLYELCKLYGERARLWRQKFAGLLPEVYKRRLYEKKGFGSIYEFAAKLAGMSQEQVQLVLNLDKSFEDKPILKSLLEEGQVSAHKLARVVSVATGENQLFWATQAKILPKAALETLVRDAKNAQISTAQSVSSASGSGIQDGLRKPKNSQKSLPGQTGPLQNLCNTIGARDHTSEFNQELNLSNEVHQKLLELQQKGININALLLEFLEKRELEIAQKKEELSATAKPTLSRYIPSAVKKILKQEYGEKCSIQTCQRSATVIHHAQRFSLAKVHDPKYLAPLCENHHNIAHSIDVKFQEKIAGPEFQNRTTVMQSSTDTPS